MRTPFNFLKIASVHQKQPPARVAFSITLHYSEFVEEFEIKPIEEKDRETVKQILKEHWGSTRMVSRGKLIEVGENPGFLALKNGEIAGLINYQIDGEEFEITNLLSLHENQGIGSSLVEKVEELAEDAETKTIIVVTTNNNEHAQNFYKNRGYSIREVNRDVLEEYRKLKPEIPEQDEKGIFITDEIVLAKEVI